MPTNEELAVMTLAEANAQATPMPEAIEQELAGGVIDTATSAEPAPAPPAQDWRIIPSAEMTADLAVKLESQGAMCLVQGSGGFMRNNMDNWCLREVAEFVTPSQAWNRWVNRSGVIYHFLMPQTLPDGRKCRIEHQFSSSFLELVREAPENPIVRAHIMRILKIGVPKEVEGYDAIKDWVEKNFSLPMIRKDPGTSLEINQVQFRGVYPAPTGEWIVNPARPAGEAPQPVGPAIDLQIRCEEDEMGRCSYSVSKTARHVHKVTLAQLREKIINDGFDWDGVLSFIREDAESEINNDDPTGGWSYSEYDYSDYSTEEHVNYSSRYEDAAAARRAIEAFLEAQDRGILDELNNN